MTQPTTRGLRTADGVDLVADHLAAADRSVGCVVAHGFTGSARTPAVRRICRGLAAQGLGVLAPDLRGHGRSGGRSTAGLTEPLDIAAAVGFLRTAGYRFVAVLGWSMGGTAVLQYAGTGGDADAVVAISAPGLWFERGTRPMRLVHWMVDARAGRLVGRLCRGTRLEATGWDAPPPAPAEIVGGIAPRPLLLVHGERDHYFPRRHLDALRAGAPSAQVWLEASMGHGEVATDDDLVQRIGQWVVGAAGGPANAGRPTDEEVVCNHGQRD